MEPDWEAISEYARVIAPLAGDEVEEDLDTEEEGAATGSELRDLWIMAAERALSIWLRGKTEEVERRNRLRESVDRRLLRQALKVLTSTRGLEGLELCKTILTTEQHVSHLVGKYLKAIVRKDPEGVTGRISEWVQEGFYLSEWQRMWLMEPLLLVPDMQPDIRDWVVQTASSQSNVVRGRALALLVYRGIVSPETAATEVESLGDPAGRDLVAAIARVTQGEGRLVNTLKKQDYLSKLIVEFAAE